MKQKNKYQKRIKILREKKLEQLKEKISTEGLLDEDDYGRIVPPEDNEWKIIPNHQDGSFYGIDGWLENFCSMIEQHPVYVDPNDAFAGRWIYFMSKMRPNIWNPDYPYDHLKPDIEKYNIIPGIGYDAHFAPDFTIGLQLGWDGLLDKIEKYQKINDNDKFYEAHKKVIKTIQLWIQNHIDEIERKILTETDPELKENLKEMLQTNKNIKHNKPVNFREACQWIIWFHLASRSYNRDGAGGQLDVLLWNYYQEDIKQGLIDDEKAVYYLSALLVNDPVYWQLGGPDENGEDVTNHLSYLILEAADLINTSLNLTIRVHEKLDSEFLKKSISYLIKHKNAWPRYSGDKSLVKGFVRNGYSEELARKRIAVGCNWMSLPGLEYTLNDLVKINIAKVFEIAFNEMIDKKDIENSVSNLWRLFTTNLKSAVQTTVEGINHHLKFQKYNEPELLLNLLSQGPLEKGLDVSDGGATYYNLAIDGAGLATVADSFAALEQRIEKENKTDWQQVNYYLKSNWEDTEGILLQKLMKNSERYAQGNSLGDSWAKKISVVFSDYVVFYSDEKKKFLPGWFSWANTLEFGRNVGATPDGRSAFEPISHGANPNPGYTLKGAVTSMAKGIAEIQPGYGNTAPMQLEFDPFIANMDNVDIIEAVIKSHFELGGTLINVNILNKETLLAAHKNPELYPDLVVRVTGFTAYFSMLTKDFRQLVIDRIIEN